jgi:hypothetical protein
MKKLIAPALFAMFATACASAPPPKSQLQIREYQTHTFDTQDQKQVLKACLNTLQDEGYIVKNAVPDLGLLTATKQVDVENKTATVLLALFGGYNTRYAKNSETEVTVNVSDYGKQVKVRANFSLKVIDNKGGVVDVKQIQQQEYYQDFFSRLDKALFLEATLDPSKPRPERPEFYAGRKLFTKEGALVGEVSETESNHRFTDGTKSDAVHVTLRAGGSIWIPTDQARAMAGAGK